MALWSKASRVVQHLFFDVRRDWLYSKEPFDSCCNQLKKDEFSTARLAHSKVPFNSSRNQLYLFTHPHTHMCYVCVHMFRGCIWRPIR